MNLIKKISLVLMVSTFMVSGAWAQDKVHIITVTKDGKVTVVLTDSSKEEVALVFGIKPEDVPEGNANLILKSGEKARLSNESLKKSYNEAGGKGSPGITLFNGPEDKNPKKIDFLNLTKSSGATLNLPVTPMDGMWMTTMNPDKIDGCPMNIHADFLLRMNEHTTEDIRFSRPFHPTDLKAGYKNFEWQRTSTNKWLAKAVDFGPGKKTHVPNMSFLVDTMLDVRSETKINVTAHIDVKVGKELAFALGGSTHCSMSFKGVFEKK